MRIYSYMKAAMSQGHKKRLQIHRSFIIEQCESSVIPICDHLFSREIISYYQKETILSQSINYE